MKAQIKRLLSEMEKGAKTEAERKRYYNFLRVFYLTMVTGGTPIDVK